MDTLKDWIGPLTKQAFNHVIRSENKGKPLAIGRNGRVTFEDDGSNIRASVEAKRTIQVVQWVSFDRIIEGDLSDGHTKIRSILASDAAAAFERNNRGRSITEGTKGAILKVSKFQIVLSRAGNPQFSLYIQNFDLAGCEGAGVFGNPSGITCRRGIMELAKRFTTKDTAWADKREKLGITSDHEQRPSSPESSIQSQTGTSPPPHNGSNRVESSLVSQEGFLTQATPHPFNSPYTFAPKNHSKELMHLFQRSTTTPVKDSLHKIQSQDQSSSNSKEHKPLPASTAYLKTYDTPQHQSSSSPETHSIPHTAAHLTAASGNDTTTDTGNLEPVHRATSSSRKRKNCCNTSNEEAGSPIAITRTEGGMPTPKRKNSAGPSGNNNHTSTTHWSWNKRIKLEDVRIPKDQEELIDSDNSWVPPPAGGRMPQGRVPTKLLQEWNDLHRSQPNGHARNSGPLKGANPWRWTKRIGLRDVRIPKDQQKLIDSASSWVPPHTGDRMPQANVPIQLLRQWNKHYRLNKEQHQGPSLAAGSPVPEVNGSQEELKLQEELRSTPPEQSSQVSWSESPERSPRRLDLPPDSSPEKHRQALQAKGNPMHDHRSLANSPLRKSMNFHNKAGQIRQKSWSGGDDALAGQTNTQPNGSVDESDDCDMDTSIPIPLGSQTQPELIDMEEEITSSGPSLPVPTSKGNSFTLVKQSPAVVSFGSHRNGCTRISGQCQCPLKNSSSSTKISSDPCIPATYDTSSIINIHRRATTTNTNIPKNIIHSSLMEGQGMEATNLIMDNDHDIVMGGVPQPNSHLASQPAPPSVKVLDTPLNPNDNVPRTTAPQRPDPNIGPSEPQSLKRTRRNTQSPFETPSKRHKSLDYLKLEVTPKSTASGNTSDSVADRRQSYMEQGLKPRTTQAIFNKFKQSYPDYRGSVKHFTSMCQKLQALRNQGKMGLSYLWDDFIIHQTTGYRKYLDMCADAVEDPDTYEEYFARNITTPQFKQRSLTTTHLQIVLTECGDPAAANVRTSATPVSATSRSRTSLVGTSSTSVASSPNPSPLTSMVKDAEQGLEEKPLEIPETQPQTAEVAEGSGNDGDDEDDGTIPIRQDFGGGESGHDGYYDREIPCTPMGDAHETASVELGDYDDDPKSPHEARKESPKALENTFSDYDLGLKDMESDTAETPRGPGIPGESKAMPIELGSSLESSIGDENYIAQESLDLDKVVWFNGNKKHDVDADDGNYLDENGNEEGGDDDEKSSENYHGSGVNDHADATITSQVKGGSGVSRQLRSRSSSVSSRTTTNKNDAIIYQQELIYSSSSEDSYPSPKDQPQQPPPQPEQEPPWHETANTPFKLFAQSYANLRTELGKRVRTHWTKQSHDPKKKDREPIPVDEKGVIHPPLHSGLRKDDENEGDERRVFKRGQIGWSFFS